MDRMPLVDQFPYQFTRPRVVPHWTFLGRLGNRLWLLPRAGKVAALDIQGVEHLRPLLDRDDGILIAPNHSDNADAAVLFEASRRIGRPFTYLAAFQIFRGPARFLLPRVGAFPVDREGADIRAFKAGVEILSGGRNPLVVFPEGEIYHVSDRLTPLREGAVAFATTAAKRLARSGKTVWIVPAGLKYRFLEGHDPTPALVALMGRLEARFTWLPRPDRSLVERIYRYAEGLLALKELEILGECKSGPLKGRIAALRDAILDRIEGHRACRRRDDPVPVRIKELRRACLEALREPGIAADRVADLQRDLNDLFVAVQLFSYPGDYVREQPTLERIAETLVKFEQDTLGARIAPPRGPRRATLRLGEPIDVGGRLADHARPRDAIGAITAELEGRIQSLLDEIGPGRTIADRPEVNRPREGGPPGGP